MVKLVQKTPLKEWVTVYFDPAKTTPENILKYLREKESPEATLVPPATKEKSGVRVAVENPVAGPGDLIQLTVRLPDGTKGSAKASPPKGWSAPTDPKAPSAAEAVLRIDVQAPKAVKAGKHEGAIEVKHRKEEVTIPFVVAIVPRVEPRGK